MNDSNRKPQTPFDLNSDPQDAIDDELAFHVDCLAAEAERAGLSKEEARMAAVAQFGDLSRIRQNCLRVIWKERMMHRIVSNSRLLLSGMFAFAVVATLMTLLFFRKNAEARIAFERARIAEDAARHARKKSEMLTDFLTQALTAVDPEIEPNLEADILRASIDALNNSNQRPSEIDGATLDLLRKAVNQTQRKLDAMPALQPKENLEIR